jgi:DNA-binding transcriptional ArsR family regulator/precorrin-6B methylase 2
MPTAATPPTKPDLGEEVPQLLLGEIVTKIVYAAVELEVPDLLADGPLTSSELAERTGTHQPSLRRLLRALAGTGIVAEIDRDLYELTELGDPLRAAAPNAIGALLKSRCGPEFWRSWGELVPSLRSGETAWDLVHGMNWVEYYARHPEPSANFNRAMSEHTRRAAPGILAAAELDRFETIMDVGGGDGTLLVCALLAHPSLEAVLFDLPSGLEAAPATLAEADVVERCRVVPGDFFEAVPAEADAYLLKQILHDWDDEAAAAILRSLRRAVGPRGRVLIIDRVLPELAGRAAFQSLLVDMLMLVVTGGRERTEVEFRDLLEAAGFELSRLSGPIPPFDYFVVEGTPRD